MPRNPFIAVWRFYVDGFRQMTVGRYLWAIIILKVAILLLVFKLFLLPDRLARDYDNDDERAKAVRKTLSTPTRQSHDVIVTEAYHERK